MAFSMFQKMVFKMVGSDDAKRTAHNDGVDENGGQ